MMGQCTVLNMHQHPQHQTLEESNCFGLEGVHHPEKGIPFNFYKEGEKRKKVVLVKKEQARRTPAFLIRIHYKSR